MPRPRRRVEEGRPPPGSAEFEAAPYFRGQDLVDAAAALRTIVPDPRDSDSVRVWRACLVLSGGRLRDLYHYVEQARRDFRDVLYWAESFDR